METKKSHNLLTTNRRTRRDRGIIQSKSENLRTREVDGANSVYQNKTRHLPVATEAKLMRQMVVQRKKILFRCWFA